MSRAFTKEDGDWGYCDEKDKPCMFAESDGSCMIGKCQEDRAAAPVAKPDNE